jgi:NADH-quinone oxidoreductase subunit G
LWNRGDEVFRVTARKDQWGEVEDWICNTCRFEKKKTSDWVIEGPRMIDRHSVISQGHYAGNVGTTIPTETFEKVHNGRQPNLLMDIHDVSNVNKQHIRLSLLERPAHSTDFTPNQD